MQSDFAWELAEDYFYLFQLFSPKLKKQSVYGKQSNQNKNPVEHRKDRE
jgi:hypothetical protein